MYTPDLFLLLLVRVLDGARLGAPIRNLTTLFTGSQLGACLECFNGLLDLSAQVGAVESSLMHNLLAALAVPPHAIKRVVGTLLLKDDANRIGKADGVVRGVGWQQEHIAFANDDIPENATVDDLEHHGALVLVKPFGCLVDVVVCSGVGTTDDLVCRPC